MYVQFTSCVYWESILRFQSEFRKIRNRNNSVFGQFPRSDWVFFSNDAWYRPATLLNMNSFTDIFLRTLLKLWLNSYDLSAIKKAAAKLLSILRRLFPKSVPLTKLQVANWFLLSEADPKSFPATSIIIVNTNVMIKKLYMIAYWNILFIHF